MSSMKKHRVHHDFRSGKEEIASGDYFQFLNDSGHAFDHYVLSEAQGTRKPGQWRYACVQMSTKWPSPDGVGVRCPCTMAEDQVCLILADSKHVIRSVGAKVPETFGYDAEIFQGMNLINLFSKKDLDVLSYASFRPPPSQLLRRR